MIPLAILYFESWQEALVVFLVVIVLFVIFFLVRRFIHDDSHIKEIVEAEKNRQAHPDVQSGMFTRLYTMPYYEELDGEFIRAYCEEHFPKYYCTVLYNMVRISEVRGGLAGEVRELYIIQLKDYNITAIRFTDPHEVIRGGRYGQYTQVRSLINDKGFSKDLREMVRNFQQQAISRQHN